MSEQLGLAVCAHVWWDIDNILECRFYVKKINGFECDCYSDADYVFCKLCTIMKVLKTALLQRRCLQSECQSPGDYINI